MCIIINDLRILIILFLFITENFFSQNLVEAVYYDNKGVPYKIDTKSTDNKIGTYISHDNQSSVCVKKETILRGDTSILKESYYYIFYRKNRLDSLFNCDDWVVSINNLSDTVWLTGYIRDWETRKISTVGDTFLTGEAIKNRWDFSEQMKKARIPSMLNNRSAFHADSLKLKETVFTYFLDGVPVKSEIYDESGEKYGMITSTSLKNKLVYKYYFVREGTEPYQVDTVSWNNDTTSVVRSSTRFEWKNTSVSKCQVKGNVLKIHFNDTLEREIEYLDKKDIFQNLLMDNLIYFDVLYYLELYFFDRKKISHIRTEKQEINNRFIYDDKGRIIEQLSYDKGKLSGRVTYRYN